MLRRRALLCWSWLLLWLTLGIPTSWGQPSPGALVTGNRTHAGATNYGLTTGSGAAYVLTLNAPLPPGPLYPEGSCYLLKIHVANTGPATLNINGKGAKTILKFVGGVSTPLVANDFGLGQEVKVCYDGVNMQAQLGGGGGTAGGLADPGSNGLVNRIGPDTTAAIPGSTVGQTLRVTGLNTFAFGPLDLTDPDAVLGVLPAANVPTVAALTSGLTPSRCLQTNGVGVISVSSGLCGTTGTGGGDALRADPLSQFAATTSAQLNTVINDNTGSGVLVFGTSPHITTPTGLLKTDVGLGSVDNTPDASKSVATAAAFTTNPLNCPSVGDAAAGVSNTGIAEGCFDVITPTELTAAFVTERTAGAILQNKTISLGNNPGLTGTLTEFNNALTGANFLPDPPGNGIVNRTGATSTAAVTSSTVGQTLVVTGPDAFAFGPLNLASPNAVSNTLPAARLPNLNTVATGLTPARCVQTDATTGLLSVAAAACGAGPGGGVAISGTPAINQAAEWTNPTTIQGVPTNGTGAYVKTTGSTINLANATGMPSTALSDSAQVVRTTGYQRVFEKEVLPREATLDATGGTITPNLDTAGSFMVNTIPGPLTIAAPVGSGTGWPFPSQEWSLCLFSNVPRALTFAVGVYSAEVGLPLPTTTTGNNIHTDCHKFRRNSRTNLWDLIATTQKTGIETVSVDLPLRTHKPYTPGLVPFDETGEKDLLVFDDVSPLCATWSTTVPPDYVGSPVLRLWYVTPDDTNTTHTAAFDAYVDAGKAGQPINVSSFGTPNPCDDSAIPGTAWAWNDISCPLTNNDTMARGEPIEISVCSAPGRGTWALRLALFRLRLEYVR